MQFDLIPCSVIRHRHGRKKNKNVKKNNTNYRGVLTCWWWSSSDALKFSRCRDIVVESCCLLRSDVAISCESSVLIHLDKYWGRWKGMFINSIRLLVRLASIADGLGKSVIRYLRRRPTFDFDDLEGCQGKITLANKYTYVKHSIQCAPF